jgi:hypothetical protein
LIGGAGNDKFLGGPGDDTIVPDSDDLQADKNVLDGGEGFDVMLLDFNLDTDTGLYEDSKDKDNNQDAISNIERISLGSGDSGVTLTLHPEDVLSMTDADNVLYVTGESNDTVQLDSAEWESAGPPVVDPTAGGSTMSGTFDMFTAAVGPSNTLVTVYVEQDVVVTT